MVSSRVLSPSMVSRVSEANGVSANSLKTAAAPSWNPGVAANELLRTKLAALHLIVQFRNTDFGKIALANCAGGERHT